MIGREHSGEVSKKIIGNFYFWGITLRVYLTGRTVAMVIYHVVKTITLSPVIGQYCGTVIIASSNKELP